VAEQRRLHHRALREIDEFVTEPLAKPYPRGQSRIARLHQAEPNSPPSRHNRPQRRHQTRIDSDPFERSVERAELDRPIKSRIEMLQPTAPAAAEMRAGRDGAPFPEVQPFDDPAAASSASAGAESRADAVARHREGQKDRRALVFGDAVATRPQPLDDKLDEPARSLSTPRF
jgi:hypothetical protein